MKIKYLVTVFLVLSHLACSSDAENVLLENSSEDEVGTNGTSEDESSTETTEGSEDSNENDHDDRPITTNLRTFIFGHSLIVHDPPLIPTPSNETTVPHWMAELSAFANYDFAVAGQYGFLPQHANLPPFSQWGFNSAEAAWDSDTQSFSDANFNSILLTAGNFIQYQSASLPYEGDNPNNTTPVGATAEIFEWAAQQEQGLIFYIYENWPDMAGFLNNGVPASASEFEAYNTYTLGDFHSWWLAYHQAVQDELPGPDIRMIPVGPIISKLLTETDLAAIPFSELYEDDAPHGRPTIYFLASLVTYMAMYGTEAPSNFEVPNTVHMLVRENYAETIDFIWKELNQFVDVEGNSLVF